MSHAKYLRRGRRSRAVQYSFLALAGVAAVAGVVLALS
jgi:hypothetical protein